MDNELKVVVGKVCHDTIPIRDVQGFKINVQVRSGRNITDAVNVITFVRIVGSQSVPHKPAHACD
jgi:hypothetical protein